tara:strand:+ start:3140 stop:3376 length:237 start_codon:yes stop_codon:yes gene_type:complete
MELLEKEIPLYQKKENEKFFLNTLNFLNDGGVYIFKDYPEYVFTKRDGKFICNMDSYAMIIPLVTKTFIKKYFYFTDD